MAKEKFLIIASRLPDDCFGLFSETENRAHIDAGTVDQNDPYAWIEASFEILLVRHREATHICSFTPSARYAWLGNAFCGEPNAAWEADGDPEGLENESGGDAYGYTTYRDEYDPRFICETFTVDTMKDLDTPMRYPRRSMATSLTRRDESDLARIETYTEAVWSYAEEAAREMMNNGAGWADICNVYTFRQWEREKLEATRARSLAHSKAMAARGLSYGGF